MKNGNSGNGKSREDRIVCGESSPATPETQLLQMQWRGNLSCKWVDRSLTTLHIRVSKWSNFLACWGTVLFSVRPAFSTDYTYHALFSNRKRVKTKKKKKRIVKRIKQGQQDGRETLLWPEVHFARVKHQQPITGQRIVQCYDVLSLRTFKFLFDFTDWSTWTRPAFSWLLWVHWCIQRGKLKLTDHWLL